MTQVTLRPAVCRPFRLGAEILISLTVRVLILAGEFIPPALLALQIIAIGLVAQGAIFRTTEHEPHITNVRTL
jgi:hypothetical protein